MLLLLGTGRSMPGGYDCGEFSWLALPRANSSDLTDAIAKAFA